MANTKQKQEQKELEKQQYTFEEDKEITEDGRYPCRLKSYSRADGQYGPYLTFWFEVTKGEFRGASVPAFFSESFSTKGKLFKFARTLCCGDTPSPDFDFDDHVGATGLITVEFDEEEERSKFRKFVRNSDEKSESSTGESKKKDKKKKKKKEENEDDDLPY